MHHLEQVFTILSSSCLLIRKTKCCFGATKLSYLGHIITTEGIHPYPDKVVAVESWPVPKTIRQVRAFLGLTRYYRRFISRYTQEATPITDLLKKNNFHWNEYAEQAFKKPKEILATASVLVYPNFELPFVLETDTCDVGVGAVLLQQEHPVAFYSKKLSALRQRASTYAKELWAVTDSVQRWRHYLLDRTFTIRTDHHPLKNLLNQTIQTPEQQYFLTKLLGYSYDIVYRKGKENVAADSLSRLPAKEEDWIKAELSLLEAKPVAEWADQLWA